MNKIYEKYLQEKYPQMFRHMYLPNTCMTEGCEISDGWFNILRVLCESIYVYLDQTQLLTKDSIVVPQKKNLDFAFLQVKEKFGKLRIYFSGGDDYIRGKVSMAEQISGYTCEYCGDISLEISQSAGCIKTLCPQCAKKNKKKLVKNKELSNLKKKIEKYDSKIKAEACSKKK